MNKSHFLPLCAVAAMFFATETAFATTDDYTNRYSFDEGTGRTVADAAGGQNGVLAGTSTGFGFASGMIGTALGMDGVSGESIALPDGFLKGSQGTISLWLKLNSLTDRNIIFSGRSTIDNYIYAALMINYEGRPQFLFRTAPDAADKRAQGGKILNKNEWYQLVFTADTIGYHMYLNSEEAVISGDNIGRWFADLSNHIFKYRIGALDSNPLSGVFDGYMDDVRIYNRALTAEEVTALYSGGNPGKPGNPVLAGGSARAMPPVTQVTLPSIPLATTTSVGVATPPVPKADVPPVSSPAKPVSPSFMRNLQVGSQGDDVRNLQLLLIKHGYLGGEFATGYFGALTKAAAIKLQKEFALPQTGFVGQMTRAKLNAAN